MTNETPKPEATVDRAAGGGCAPCGCSACAATIAELRKRNSELQRRCQQAEAAVAEVKRKWDKHGGPKGGSFGRALLACECVRLQAELDALQNDKLSGGEKATDSKS